MDLPSSFIQHCPTYSCWTFTAHLGVRADLASLIFNSEQETVNTPQKLMRGRMFN